MCQSKDNDSLIRFLDNFSGDLERNYQMSLKSMAQDDISAFAEYIDPEWFPAKHHLYILDKLQKVQTGEIEKLIVSMPVGHGKTVYSSNVFPAFCLGKDPSERIICAGHSQNFVENNITGKIRGILQRPSYREVFPNTVLSVKKQSVEYFELDPVNGRASPGFVVGKGVGGGISGYRSTLAIVDDLYPTQEDANSQTYRDKAYTWWFSDLGRRSVPGGRTVFVCTRWHSDDLIYHLLEASESGKGPKYESIILPAICEDAENDPLGRKEGEALWPDYHTIDALLAIKAEVPGTAWNALYQCKPVGAEGNVVDSKWFNYWKKLPDEEFIKRRFVSFDLANTANQRSDFSVGTAWVQTTSGQFFLVDIMRERLEFTGLVKRINDFAVSNKAECILIEDAGVGKTIYQAMSGDFNAPLVMIPTNNKHKEFRLDSITPLFQTGQVLFPPLHPLIADVERELAEFPYGKHDDIPDSVSQALNWARGMNVKRGTKKVRGGY